jgi:hypothetical protein
MQTFSILRLFKIYPNLDFWFENKSSGNPGCQEGKERSSGLPDGLFSNQKSQFGQV